jgi:hypothetical protein
MPPLAQDCPYSLERTLQPCDLVAFLGHIQGVGCELSKQASQEAAREVHSPRVSWLTIILGFHKLLVMDLARTDVNAYGRG